MVQKQGKKTGMKVLAVNGSPRGKKSVTAIIVEEFLSGARESGCSTEHLFLSEMTIHPCTGCLSCWKNGGSCRFNDDRAKIKEGECDILVLATPIYVDNVSGLLKTFIDRSVACANPLMEADPSHGTVHIKNSEQRPKLVAIANCGYPEQTHFDVVRLFFRRYARNLQTELIGEIYRGEGPLLQDPKGELKGIVDAYKRLVRTAGREIGSNLQMRRETILQLEEPLIPYNSYRQKCNEHWQTQLRSTSNGNIEIKPHY